MERTAVEEATLAAGAAHASLIDEPLAAAIGADLPVADSVGALILDIGGGTSEIAVTALGGLVVAHSIQVGGYELDDAIVRAAQQHEQLLIGQEQAERLKVEVGSAFAGYGRVSSGEVAGRDLLTGLLRRARFDEEQVRAVLNIPATVRVLLLLAVGHLVGEDGRHPGRLSPARTVFSETYGQPFPMEV